MTSSTEPIKMGRSHTTRRRSGRVRQEEVVEAATKLFHKGGYHGTSMQDIADAVGLQKGSLYLHLTSKEALLSHIVIDGLTEILHPMEVIANSDASPLEKLEEAVKHHVSTNVMKQDGVGVFLEDSKHLSPGKRRKALGLQKRYESLIRNILEEGIRVGQFRPCDTKIVAYALLGMCNWTYRWCSKKGPLSPEEVARIFVDVLITGIGAQTTQEIP